MPQRHWVHTNQRYAHRSRSRYKSGMCTKMESNAGIAPDSRERVHGIVFGADVLFVSLSICAPFAKTDRIQLYCSALPALGSPSERRLAFAVGSIGKRPLRFCLMSVLRLPASHRHPFKQTHAHAHTTASLRCIRRRRHSISSGAILLSTSLSLPLYAFHLIGKYWRVCV